MSEFVNAPKIVTNVAVDSQTHIDENYVNQFVSEKCPGNFAVLKLAVNKSDAELAELYKTHIDKHNE